MGLSISVGDGVILSLFVGILVGVTRPYRPLPVVLNWRGTSDFSSVFSHLGTQNQFPHFKYQETLSKNLNTHQYDQLIKKRYTEPTNVSTNKSYSLWLRASILAASLDEKWHAWRGRLEFIIGRLNLTTFLGRPVRAQDWWEMAGKLRWDFERRG